MYEGLDEYISNIAAAKPLPGGGSAAALAGTLAAALGEMMAGLTEGRSKFAAVQLQLSEILAKISGFRKILHALIREDPAAYQSLMDAWRLPKATEEETEFREKAIESATRRATETPMQTAQAAVEVLEALKVLIEIGNPHVKCDAAVGAHLAHAALKAGQYNALANIRTLKDRQFAETCRVKIAALVQRGQSTLQSIDDLLIGR